MSKDGARFANAVSPRLMSLLINYFKFAFKFETKCSEIKVTKINEKVCQLAQ